MPEQRWVPKQRAFSPEEVSTMLGVSCAVVLSLLKEGKLGSKKIGSTRRIFLSDLEDYLGQERARSLVRDLNSERGKGEEETQRSRFEEVAQKWNEIPEDQAIVLASLTQSDVRDLRGFLYSRLGKENVLVRSAKQEEKGRLVKQEENHWRLEREEATFKVVVQNRESSEYLRD